MLTLWQAQTDAPGAFDKNENIGLHHLALRVDSLEALEHIYRVLQNQGIAIEFPPEPLANTPATHMMCYPPSGIRLEFIHMPEGV